ncbi:SprT family zinc-dependent metalloprotease [Seohaeicola saemankumensis]|jgi:predicted metal-dependent hydrolase|uniref:M48 family metallopeptidase n=1 Tax=Seohaeicola TaxID=481178 RepID=UPI0007F466AD|nr:SprT family zinc-dependent metalloprotease [Paracoccaceae bacterium]OAN67403.1 zinc metalloprotease [Rhodobacteraceae bacterium EhC02]
MGQHFLPGNPPVAITLRKTAQARRISLRISRLDGRVTLTCPLRVSDREALAFAHEKADWLRQNLIANPGPARIGIGAELPLEGRLLRIASGSGRLVRVEDDHLLVPGAPDRSAARIAGFLKHMARDRLAAASDHYAARLGRGYDRISLRDTRSRWGSCTADGGLMYSWRLIMAPPEVLAYVAAHEVAHLAEMNHSDAFWSVVTRLYGDYRAPRRWLREKGGDLHRYDFGG